LRGQCGESTLIREGALGCARPPSAPPRGQDGGEVVDTCAALG